MCIRLNQGKDVDHWQLTVGCSLPGKWVLHWGVHYVGDTGRFDFLSLLLVIFHGAGFGGTCIS